MIPILYDRDETRFLTNGIGRLSDCTRAVVTEERNGIYELEFDMPITGAHFDEIELGKIVACTHDDKHDIQPFVVYHRSVPDLNGIVTFNAHHISYRLSDIVVEPFAAGTVAEALQLISSKSINRNPFTFWTDKTTMANFENSVPKNARNILGGEEGSILDVFGAGDYEFDRFQVKLYAHRGVDSDVEIRYSKNLTDLSEDIDDGETYNAIVPYWADAEGNYVSLPEKMIVFSGTEPEIAYLTDHNLIILRTETNEPIEAAYTVADAVPMDLSDAFPEQPTAAQLRAAAIARFNASGAWLPDENLRVDFIQLAQTEEFAEYAALQRVSLCDTVSVYYPQVGIAKVKQKVVKVAYNVLLDRYDSIELGAVQTSLGQQIKREILKDVPTTSMMDAAIEYATDLIRGGLGGYVVMPPGPTGYPDEILIMDSPSTDTAVNVWRFNKGGLGHSSNGYQGPFTDIALTADGKINASMITTGALNADLITAGTMSADRISGGTLVAGGDTSGIVEVRNAYGTAFMQINRYGVVTYRSSSLMGLYYGAVLSGDSLSFIRNESIDFNAGTKFSNPEALLRLYYLDLDPSQSSQVSSLNMSSTTANVAMVARAGGASVKCYHDTATESITRHSCDVRIEGDVVVKGSLHVKDTLSTSGEKSREVKTRNYESRYLYAYETPKPLFGDIGEAQLDSDGICYVDIDDIFSETIELRHEYQVFLQKEGEGDCWIAEKHPRYFVIKGTPNLKVAWELKAKQRDYDTIRLEQPNNGLDEYEHTIDDDSLLDSYINEQEELLYG
jgi:hypothetical protein